MAFDTQGNFTYNPGDLAFGPQSNLDFGNIFNRQGNQSVFNPQGSISNNNGSTPVTKPKIDKTGYNPYIEGINAVAGLADAYLGFQNLDLSKKQFGFLKDTTNRNLANQASLTNTNLESQQYARMAGQGNYDRSTATGREALSTDLEKYLAPRRVSGAPV